jgi:hypothetical protein
MFSEPVNAYDSRFITHYAKQSLMDSEPPLNNVTFTFRLTDKTIIALSVSSSLCNT